MVETLTVEQMAPNKWEPKRRFRWILDIDGIDQFLLKQAERPRFTRGGRVDSVWTVSNMRFEIYDPIVPSGSQQIWEWMQEEDKNKRQPTYKGRTATLKLLDPVGSVVETWVFEGMKLIDVDFGPLSYAGVPEERDGKASEAEIGWINSTRYIIGPPSSLMTIGVECSVESAELLPH